MRRMSAKISVIIPFYNEAAYLPECVTSGFASYTRPMGAPGDSRNAGLAMATGEYVAFVDHDDRLEPTSFAQLMALQERTQAEIVMANFFFHVEGEAGFQAAFSKDDYFE